MFKWIDVREALPHTSRHVLVATTSGSVQHTFFCTYPKHFDYMKSYAKGHNRFFELAVKYGYEITHWMDLPTAPAKHKTKSSFDFLESLCSLKIINGSEAVKLSSHLGGNPFVLEGADYSGY